MMTIAGQRIGPYSDRFSVRAALLLWHAAYRCAAGDDGRVRVLKTIMDLADRYPAICASAIDVLQSERGEFVAEGFVEETLAGLLYYQQQYRAVLELTAPATAATAPTLAALRAEALRKLDRHAEAIAACDELIAALDRPGAGRLQHEALVSALCCRGYARFEIGRDDAGVLPEAEHDLRRALDVAARTGVPEPPRAHTGIGYLRKLQGRADEAEQAFAVAQRVDEDNRKAADGLDDPGRSAEAPTDSSDQPKRDLMNEARRHNELLNDVDGAIARWREAHALGAGGGDRSAVVAIMMSAARKRASSDLAPEHRDVPGAARIYQAVYRLGVHQDQKDRQIRTMMATANRFTDLTEPAARRDVPGAITLWQALLELELPRHEVQRILRTMMNVASMLTDSGAPGRELDADGAIAIWRAAHAHAGDAEERRRIARTVRAVAGRFGEEAASRPSLARAAERLRAAVDELG
jgi:tetratricopeptide (TPR) repeat protein